MSYAMPRNILLEQRFRVCGVEEEMEGFGAHAAGGSSGTFGSSNSGGGGDAGHRDYLWYDRRRDDFSSGQTGESSAPVSCRSVLYFILFPFFVLASLAIGWQPPQKIEAGAGYSRLLDANPLFIRQIEVKKIQGAGEALLYAFPKPPSLEDRLDWAHEFNRDLNAYSHQEWALWLNKGSTMRLTYNIRGGHIIFAVSQGIDEFRSWVENPWNPSSSVYWQKLEGSGNLTFDVDKNGDYYYSFGNMNRYPVEMALRLEAELKLYSTDEAESKCSLKTQSCRVDLPILDSTAVLLTTSEHDGLQHMSITYKTRWATFVVGFGTLAAAVVLLVKKPWKRPSREVDQDDKPKPEEASPMIDERSSEENRSNVYNRIEECSNPNQPGDEQFCAVCLDAPKNSFFDPCGHCATCYECGKRIKASGNATCPICRENIRSVRRLFVS